MLQDRCASRLATTLNIDNACELLEIADVHDVPQLRKAAIDFIVINVHAFIGTAVRVCARKLSKRLLTGIRGALRASA